MMTFRATIRGARREWWIEKLTRNAARDREVTALLLASGWRVVRLWESDVLAPAAEMALQIAAPIETPGISELLPGDTRP